MRSPGFSVEVLQVVELLANLNLEPARHGLISGPFRQVVGEVTFAGSVRA